MSSYSIAYSSYLLSRAFNVETATVIDSVRGNALPGQIRLQWWKDVVHSIYTDGQVPSGYPVVESLVDAIATHGLNRRWFDRILESRERDLVMEKQQPESMRVLEQYCDDTATSMILLSLECLRPPDTTSTWRSELAEDLAAQHTGQAVALCTLLRGTAFHAARGRLYLPADLMQHHGARARSVLMGPDPPVHPTTQEPDDSDLGSPADYATEADWEQAVEERRKRRRQAPISEAQRVAARAAVRDLSMVAGRHLDAAAALFRGSAPAPPTSSMPESELNAWYAKYQDKELTAALEAGGAVPKQTTAAFLPAVASRRYLAALEACGYDLHDPRLWPTPAHEQEGSGRLALQFRLLTSSLGLTSPLK